jgi:hypothetical protein
MKGEQRKAAIAAYKEQKVVPGIYAIRCAASGDVWVGEWANIGTIQNRIWFTLRQGAHPNRDLLGAWQQYGEDAFRFEVLERLEEKDDAFYSPNAFLKERGAHWRLSLNAKSV